MGRLKQWLLLDSFEWPLFWLKMSDILKMSIFGLEFCGCQSSLPPYIGWIPLPGKRSPSNCLPCGSTVAKSLAVLGVWQMISLALTFWLGSFLWGLDSPKIYRSETFFLIDFEFFCIILDLSDPTLGFWLFSTNFFARVFSSFNRSAHSFSLLR